ncbi:hypothetical protein [Flavobacterium johnsoniae]|jgi:hypothetical protein|uniref:N-acetyltransferase domain-containing protein n=1 Tax=Flavobacterium johnsoniae TaxID=986 RepID=A0A1J7CN90_FLAJO|nr:hypothetical protein [Flavobacterium johnsoniae]OIV41122.1 hypothetical protein BKM63_15635 [Flavobacterium johnsoniae]
MDTTLTPSIQFDPISLSSLKSVINIYQNRSSKNFVQDRNISQLSHDFGLPLSVALCENRVVGYAFVTINEREEPEINSYWEKEFYSIEAEQDLKIHAEETCHSLFKDAPARSIKIQNAAAKLSSWLQVCN